jgi:hypothetical protein
MRLLSRAVRLAQTTSLILKDFAGGPEVSVLAGPVQRRLTFPDFIRGIRLDVGSFAVTQCESMF